MIAQAQHKNNFNLIRFVAAFAVLASHSFVLTGNTEPEIPFLHLSLGRLAVDIFFIISGYLVTASLLRQESITQFIRARFLRIYPALWLMLVLEIFILGIFFSSLNFSAFISHHQTLVYLAKCATLIANVTYYLPGTFETNPFPKAVNGSLWSLPYEIKLYFVLALVGLLIHLTNNWRKQGFVGLVIFLLVVSFIGSELNFGKGELLYPLAALFFCGSLSYGIRNLIPLNFSFFLMAIIFLLLNKIIFTGDIILYSLYLSYCVLFLAFYHNETVQKFNRLGDYSYGIYIYAFPIQQCLVALLPQTKPLELFIYSSMITLCCAVFSWHFVERPCLNLKKQSFSI